jgi:hypothetical protein
MPVGGSTWAHGADDEVTETELPQGVQFSISEMPVRYAPQPPTEAQQKLRREVPGPTRKDGE